MKDDFHYANRPMQYTAIFTGVENVILSEENVRYSS